MEKFNALKKIIVIIILFLLLFQPWGMQLYYLLKQCQVKQYMQELVKSETETETLVLSSRVFVEARLGWNEIYWMGKMYDIKAISFTRENVFLKVVADHHEDAIHSKIKLTDQHNPGKESKGSAAGMDWSTIDFIIPSNASEYIQTSCPVTFLQAGEHFYIDWSPGITLPPPWFS